LKFHKTAKEMFAKIWRKQAKICEHLHKKLATRQLRRLAP